MKVFISQPMSSRTDEEVFETRNKIKQYMIKHLANKCKPEEIEFISAYDDPFSMNLTEEDLKGKRENVYRLGHAIELLSEADCVAFANDHNSRGCKGEKAICNLYNIPYIVTPV